mmetsp:Transcript_16014/g.26618  ORF Transcript_16014/g.26618 Transcript_16014/m.26618 type:complete len:89 (-) Transcript_16014:206-472(-)
MNWPSLLLHLRLRQSRVSLFDFVKPTVDFVFRLVNLVKPIKPVNHWRRSAFNEAKLVSTSFLKFVQLVSSHEQEHFCCCAMNGSNEWQ